MIMLKRILMVCLVWVATALSVFGQVPGLISHQGKVTLSGTNYSGAGQFKFALVNSAGDTTYWSNDGTSTAGGEPTAAVALTVTRGVFSLNLGDTTLTHMTAIPSSVFTQSAVYLRTWFSYDGVLFIAFTPDRRVTSVGYAFRAGTAGSADAVAAANVTGTLGLSQLPSSVVTNNATAVTLAGTFTGSGAGLNNVNADQLDGQHGAYYKNASDLTGTLADARLSANVAQLSSNQVFTASNRFAGVVTLTNLANTFAGDGSGLVNLNLNRAEGSSLTIGQEWGDGPFQIFGSTWVLDQQNVNFGYYFTRSSPWQSFTAGAAGSLAAIKAWIYSLGGVPWSATLNLYAGEGTAGVLLASQPVAGDGVAQERTFALDTPVSLILGSQYTFALQNASGNLRLRGSGDVYAGGRCDYSASYDYLFSTWMTNTTAAPVLVVQPNTLYVGIGKANPTSALDVNGTLTAGNFVGNAAGLTNLDASDLTGTLADARLSANVAQLSSNQVFTASNRFSGVVTATNVANTFAGTFAGTGAGLTNVVPADGSVTAAKLAAGAVTSASLASDLTVAGTISATSFQGGGVLQPQTVSGTTQVATTGTSYLLANEDQTTVTLPTSANVGDLVKVTGLGAGGWQVEGPLAGVPAGAVWTARAFGANWSSVASSADGTKLVATVYGGLIYTSTDAGTNWTPRGPNLSWQGVASSADGTKLVAVARFAPIYTSTDSGTNWTARGPSVNWMAAASSADGTKLVAVNGGTKGVGPIYTSTDAGTNWTAWGPSLSWQGVASSADGTKLVAVARNAPIYTSTDSGTNWTARADSRDWNNVASSADGTKLVAAPYGDRLYTSTDSGTNWTARGPALGWQGVASSADGTKLVAAVNGGLIYTSADSGVTWAPHASSQPWWSVASSADGTKVVAVVSSSSGQIFTSGQTVTGAAGATTTLQYIGGGQWRPLSASDSSVGSAQLAAGSVGSSQLASTLTINSALGIGNTTPGFPLSFANTMGDKISLWGDSGNHYGFGIQSYLLQVYSDSASGDIAFGYGQSTNFTENVRFKGNGNVGIGTTNPTTALEVNGTITANQFVGTFITASSGDYVFAYSTDTQDVATVGTFQDITCNVNAQLNGWTHPVGTANFTCGASGLYLVQYKGQVQFSEDSAAQMVSLRAIVGAAEIDGSDSAVYGKKPAATSADNIVLPVSASFIANFTAGNVLKFQITGAAGSGLLPNTGYSSTSPSFSCTITRLK
jgi:hypothetical protein